MPVDPLQEEWAILWDRAKFLERTLPEQRREALVRLKAKHPNLAYKTWAGIAQAYEAGTLPPSIAADAAPAHQRLATLAEEALSSRRTSERLLAERLAADKRPWLAPDEPIPAGEYSKLADCSEYPLRLSCNYGENQTARWQRCIYMQYGGSPGYWQCAAPSQQLRG